MLQHVLFGLATYVPGVKNIRRHQTGGTDTAQYCYSVWMRHLNSFAQFTENKVPKIIAELGPGDSLGIGLAALLSGAERYIGLDVAQYASNHRNHQIFDELVSLFKNRAFIPDDAKFPRVRPKLNTYNFPSHILSDARLADLLETNRIEHIRWSLDHINHPDSCIRYVAPWFGAGEIRKNEIDLIFSQAVLEHVDQLEDSYSIMAHWLKPSGMMSHQVDFKCHGLSKHWNGHWAISDFTWKLVRGNRDYLLNRATLSTHFKFLEKAGFKVLSSQKVTTQSSIERHNLAGNFRKLCDEDLNTSGVFFVAKKIV